MLSLVICTKLALSIFLSTLLGVVWYSSSLFGKIVARENGKTGKRLPIYSRWGALLMVIVLQVWMLYGFDILFGGAKSAKGVSSGATGSALLALFFVGPATIITSLYQQRSFKLWLVDVFYQILSLAIMGAVMFGLSVRW